MLPINHVSYGSTGGGAAIAAHRLHLACLGQGLASQMTVVEGPQAEHIAPFRRSKSLRRTLQREWARHLRKKYAATQVAGLASLAVARSGLADHLNRQAPQITHLHWVNSDMISIPEIGRIRRPVVWTLHDMWAFCGAEHYTEAEGWRSGYADSTQRGFDINRWVWTRKRRHWISPFQIVCPSNWLASCVRESALMRDWPVRCIPNAIDTDLWRPLDKAAARSGLNLPHDAPMVVFGAMGGDGDPRKGFTYLKEAMMRVHARFPDLHAIVFGSEGQSDGFPFPVHFTGPVNDTAQLQRIYSAADVFALPSRQDNLPNTGVEALACGVPIAGFAIGGLTDLVPDPQVGHLARPFDEANLAEGIGAILESRNSEAGLAMSAAARRHAEQSYAAPVIAAQYAELYQDVLAR
ncbi:glycosyltransferase [Ruegeria jejuensis]|uniref:glycosyltransferase n=1 Tax=Ruegeria jejuensis TaxID=3233338 RepID=UPI00355B0C12